LWLAVLIYLFAGLLPDTAFAELDRVYILRTDSCAFVNGADVTNDSKMYGAGAGSTFYIYGSISNSTGSIGQSIAFTNAVAPIACNTAVLPALSNSIYFRYSKIPNETQPPQAADSRIKDIRNDFFYKRKWDFVHGLLVVPFKYRTGDGSLSGNSSIGYYAGTSFYADTYTLMPFISAGLTEISVNVDPDTDEVENASGLTVALGYIFKDSSNFQIGAVLGIDHLGGSKGNAWEYEDDPWISISVGYNFAQ
jgi:hypothetical protein